MTSSDRVRAAIVGAGLMGRWHARAIERSGGIVAAVIDPSAAHSRELAEAHGALQTSTLGEAVDRTSIDVVHICSPLETHVVIARETIALGKHALIEKPLVPTAGETEQILGDAAARNVLVCPVHQFLFQRGVRDVIAALPRIAPVLHVSVTSCSAGADLADAKACERVAFDILPHPLSLGVELMDAPLADIDWGVRRSAPGELLASGRAGSTTLTVLISMAGRPTANVLRVIGARGSAHADLFHGFAVIESGSVSRARKILHPFTSSGASLAHAFANLARRAMTRETAYPGLRELVARFHAAIRGDASAPIPPAHILDVARARDVLMRLAPTVTQKIV